MLIILPIVLGACAKPATAEYGSARFFAMDTVIDVRLAKSDGVSDEAVAAITEKCGEIVADYEEKLSRTVDGSPVSSFNEKIDFMVDPDADMLAVLQTAIRLSSLTDGAFSPSLGTLTSLWDITSESPVVPSDEAIAEALTHTDISTLTVTESEIIKGDPLLQLDLGGIGKGAAAGAVLEYLSTTGIAYGLVSMGGNVGVFGEKPDGEMFKIGIRDPDDENGVLGYIFAGAGFISVSGDYERYFIKDGTRYHHIIDPATGQPARSGLRSVAVWCLNGAAADALSTALFVTGVEGAMELYESNTIAFEAVFVTENKEIIITDGLKNRFEHSSVEYTLVSENKIK